MIDVFLGVLFFVFSVAFFVLGSALYGGRVGVIHILYLSHLFIQEAPAIYMLVVEGGRTAEFFFLINSWSALLMAFLSLLFQFFNAKKEREAKGFSGGVFFNELRENRQVVFFYFCFCLILLLFYVSKTGASPLFSLLSGQLVGFDAVEARLSANAGQQGLIFGMALRFFMPVLFVMGVILLVSGKGKVLPSMCVLIAFIYTAWAMDKTPVVALFVLLLLYFVFYRQDLKREEELRGPSSAYAADELKKSKKVMLFFVGLAVLYPVFIFSFLPASENGWDYVFGHIFKRIFFIPALNSYAAIEIFSESRGFTFFRDVSGYAKLIGEEYFNLSFYVASHRGMIEGSYSPPAAIGNFYAQTGMVGVFVGVVTAVLVFKLAEYFILNIKSSNIVKSSSYILLAYGAFRFSWANFHTILVTEVVLPAVLMVVLAKILVGKRL